MSGLGPLPEFFVDLLKTLTPEQAKQIIRYAEYDTFFDPMIVDVLLVVIKEKGEQHD